MLRTYIESLKKDFRLVVRNWHTILSIMLLPLLLVILIGMLFSTQQNPRVSIALEGINASIFSGVDGVNTFNTNSCSDAIRNHNAVACVAKSDNGMLNAYFDNSKLNLYTYVFLTVQSQIEKQNKILAANKILDLQSQLQKEMVGLSSISDELAKSSDSLGQQKNSLQNVQNTLDMKSRDLNDSMQNMQMFILQIQSQKNSYESDKSQIKTQTADLKMQLSQLQSQINQIDMNALEKQDPQLAAQIKQFNSQVDNYYSAIDLINQDLDKNSQTYDMILAQSNNVYSSYQNISNELNAQKKFVAAQSNQLGQVEQGSKNISGALITIDKSFKGQLSFTPESVINSLTAHFKLFYDKEIKILILPTILMMIVVFLSVIISSLLGFEEVSSDAMLRLELSGASRFVADFSKLTIITLMVLINILILLIFSSVFWNTNYGSALILMLGFAMPGIMFFANIGLSLSYVVRKPFVLFIMSSFLSIAIMISTGILRPKEMLSPAEVLFINSNPATMILEGLRALILGSSYLTQLYLLVAAAAVSFFILWAARFYWQNSIFND